MSIQKAILLAGGHGTRLYPLTAGVNKHLLPIYNKPMIYYPLCTAMQAGAREILLIGNPQDIPQYERLLGDGSQWGLSIAYTTQAEPKGIAEAFLIAEAFTAGDPVLLILGDNVFYGDEMPSLLKNAAEPTSGASVFAYRVSDPERYGVVSFDSNQRATKIIEKPQQAESSFAVTGIYFYDGTAAQRVKSLTPSARGELEITDLNQSYLDDGQLSVEIMESGIAWLDTGTHRSLMEASAFVHAVEHRQGMLIAAPAYVAFQEGIISYVEASDLAKNMKQNSYRARLESLLAEASTSNGKRCAA